MKTVCLNILVMLLSIASLTACHDEPVADTPTGNFEALWSALDRHYCFFQYKNVGGRRCTTDMPQKSATA